MSMGTVALTAAAIIRFHWVLYSPWKTLNSTVTGSMFSEFSTINGHRKLFQTP